MTQVKFNVLYWPIAIVGIVLSKVPSDDGIMDIVTGLLCLGILAFMLYAVYARAIDLKAKRPWVYPVLLLIPIVGLVVSLSCSFRRSGSLAQASTEGTAAA